MTSSNSAPAHRVLPAGDRAVLIELNDDADVLPLYTSLLEGRHYYVGDIVPGERTLLVTLGSSYTFREARRWLLAALKRPLPPGAESTDREHVIPVTYNGEDLADAADELGITADDVVARHQAAAWRVAFMGFAPGFGYLLPASADGAGLVVARRSEARTRVPAGSVALADRYSAIYPNASPGGWRLIGRTSMTLWDSGLESPSLLAPGDTVRFVDDSKCEAPA